MIEVTEEELLSDFDNYLFMVDAGETLLIKSKHGDLVMLPTTEYEELIRHDSVREIL